MPNIMKTKHKHLLASLVLSFCASPAMAVSSLPGEIEYAQPDGSTIMVRIQGDEHHHWYTDLDGRLLMPTEDGTLVPADESFKTRLSVKQASKDLRATPYTKYPTTGEQKVLIILAQFQDKKFTYSADEFRNMLREPGYSAYGAAGSAYDYYVENSAGRFIPDFEVFGPVTLPSEMAYYGANDDANAHQMVVEACKQLDPQIDFSEYDRDGDGWVDNVYVFYAGYGEADGGGANTIWPHSANVSSKGERLMLDGVSIGSYSCSNELIGGSTRLVGIGTFCHEFGHVLGLPDVYSTNNNSAFTPYYYSLMDHGNYNGDGRCPCALTAYERYFLGWCEPRELSADGSVRLAPISDNIAFRLSLPGYDEQYFLLENRVKEGWDEQLPGEGLLIWHIDYSRDVWNRNGVNNDESRQRIDLIEADRIESLRSSAGDPFPGSAGVTSFAEFKDHTGAVYPHKLSNIRYDSKSILFDFNTASAFPEAVKNLASKDVEDESFNLSWDAVEGVDGYIVSVATEENGRVRRLSEFTAVPAAGNSLAVTRLSPETEYQCLVRSVKGVSISEPSASLTVKTAEPGIGYFAPVALEASEVSESGFTANWESMPQADRYLLDVFTMSQEAVDKDIAGFTTPLSVPEGWNTTATGTMSVNGYYGAAAPSLRLAQNAEVLETPDYGKEIQSVSFWMRGYKATADSKIVVSGLYDGSWKELSQITGISNTQGSIWDWSATTVGQKGPQAIRLTYYGPSGASVCVDDVTISFGLAEVKKKVVDRKDMNLATNFAVTGLEADREYTYIVYGAKGEKLSLPSEEIAVKTKAGGSAVTEIADENADAPTEIYTLTGQKIGSLLGQPAGVYIVKQGSKVVKVISDKR